MKKEYCPFEVLAEDTIVYFYTFIQPIEFQRTDFPFTEHKNLNMSNFNIDDSDPIRLYLDSMSWNNNTKIGTITITYIKPYTYTIDVVSLIIGENLSYTNYCIHAEKLRMTKNSGIKFLLLSNNM